MSEEHPIFYTQWAVIQKIVGTDPQLMPQICLDRDGAERYREFLLDRDAEIKEKARQEELENFPDGNQNWHHWNTGITYGRRPLKLATYHLAVRRVSDWSEIE